MDTLSAALAMRLYMNDLAELDQGVDADDDGEDISWARGLGDEKWIAQQRSELEAITSRNNKSNGKGKGKGKEADTTRLLSVPARPKNPHPNRAGPTTPICVSCMDAITGAVQKASCNHTYCTNCLTHLLISSIKGESGIFPPSCCKKPFSPATIKALVPANTHKVYTTRLSERTGAAVHFCPHPRCSARLGPANIKGETGTCPRCQKRMCTKCKSPEHRGACPESDLADLARRSGWKECPECGRMAEKIPGGCKHMTCPCGAEYCYECNSTDWKNCACKLWSDEDMRIAVREHGYLFGAFGPGMVPAGPFPVAMPFPGQGMPIPRPGVAIPRGFPYPGGAGIPGRAFPGEFPFPGRNPYEPMELAAPRRVPYNIGELDPYGFPENPYDRARNPNDLGEDPYEPVIWLPGPQSGAAYTREQVLDGIERDLYYLGRAHDPVYSGPGARWEPAPQRPGPGGQWIGVRGVGMRWVPF